jgi:rhodanese-related sulfurtransferase
MHAKEHPMNAPVELPPAREVCPTTTRRLLGEGALLVDVRELNEVARLAFDVPGVLLMPLSELEQRYAELPRDRQLVLVCAVGERSLKATYFLMVQGYTQVANMEGGIMKWARKGFPIRGTAHAAAPAATGCCGSSAPAAVDTPASACCGPEAAPGTTATACCGTASAAPAAPARTGCC